MSKYIATIDMKYGGTQIKRGDTVELTGKFDQKLIDQGFLVAEELYNERQEARQNDAIRRSGGQLATESKPATRRKTPAKRKTATKSKTPTRGAKRSKVGERDKK